MKKSEAENKIKALKKELTETIKKMRKDGKSLKELKRISTMIRDKEQVILDAFPGEFEGIY